MKLIIRQETINLIFQVFIVSLFSLIAEHPGLQAQSTGNYNVGYMVLDLQYPQDGLLKKLTVAVWYPTGDTPRMFRYGGPAWGKVAPNGKLLTGEDKFPFLVFSHGYGGSGIASQFFTEKLASCGWIVACPDHNDPHTLSDSRTGRTSKPDVRGTIKDAREIASAAPDEREKYLYRPAELEKVIEIMVSSDPFSSAIDTSRIAAGGHSFGGFTSLALCGAIPGFNDSRIKALLLFSAGAAGYLFTEEELSEVKVPTMLYLGSRETKQKRGDKTMYELSQTIYRNMPVPKYFLVVRGANHFSFNIRLSDNPGSEALSGNVKEFDVINRYSVAFLEKYAAGKSGLDSVLDSKDRMLTKIFCSR